MGGWNRKTATAHRLEGTWRRDRHGDGDEVDEGADEVPSGRSPDPVPPPPRGMRRDEREVWRELAPAVADRFQRKYTPAFRLLVGVVANLRRLPVDAPLTARARAEQAAMSALSRWGLDPGGDANLGPIPLDRQAPQRFYRLPSGRIADEGDREVRKAIEKGTAQLVGYVASGSEPKDA